MLQQEFLSFVTSLVPSWRKSQRRVLALSVRALVVRRCGTRSALALKAPLPSFWESQVRLRSKLSWLTLALEWLASLAWRLLLNDGLDSLIATETARSG